MGKYRMNEATMNARHPWAHGGDYEDWVSDTTGTVKPPIPTDLTQFLYYVYKHRNDGPLDFVEVCERLKIFGWQNMDSKNKANIYKWAMAGYNNEVDEPLIDVYINYPPEKGGRYGHYDYEARRWQRADPDRDARPINRTVNGVHAAEDKLKGRAAADMYTRVKARMPALENYIKRWHIDEYMPRFYSQHLSDKAQYLNDHRTVAQEYDPSELDTIEENPFEL